MEPSVLTGGQSMQFTRDQRPLELPLPFAPLPFVPLSPLRGLLLGAGLLPAGEDALP